MKRLGLIRRALFGVLSGALAVQAPAAAEVPPPAAPAPAPSFKVMDLSAYLPVEAAPGAPGTRPLALAPADDRTLDPAAAAKAQAYSDSLGGYALLVWQGGRIVYERYGRGADETTRFETFSMHKSVLALLYGAALRDGLIASLDDPVGRYLEEWRSDPRGRTTLRQLLTMESGLSLPRGDVRAEIALAQVQEAPAGQGFEYNNADPEILGLVLDRTLRAAGRGDYARYLSESLLKPLGAGDAHLWVDAPGGEPRFYAFCQMRARDWLRVGMLIDRKGLFEGTRVLPQAWIAAQTSPSPLNPNYGLLTWIGSPWSRQRAYSPRIPVKVSHAEPFLASDLIFFDGSGGQRVYIAPSLDLVVVRVGEPSMAFDDSVIPNAVIAGLRPK